MTNLTEKETDRGTDRERETERDRETDRHRRTDTQTRQRQTETDRHRLRPSEYKATITQERTYVPFPALNDNVPQCPGAAKQLCKQQTRPLCVSVNTVEANHKEENKFLVQR